ncbi:OstA-like protein [Flavobacterium cheniae]|uniref:OstA-like protein n=1 Tax=Flavobacterium cheniae TaxID=295428 RepID=A0A562KNS5_9FLAO|nr:OstA-like protein [Flavobacterium cheniae]TWH97030.1 OstA-like protein [Flavobacterium cheniae]
MLKTDKKILIKNRLSTFYLNLAQNKSDLKNTFFYIAFLLLSVTFSVAQEKKKIIIENSDFVDMNQTEIPGAIVFTGNVRIIHNGVKMFCNKAYHFKDENYVKAFGNVQMNQGDTITMNSRYAEYNGDKELAFATGDVVLRSPESTLTTDTVYFDKKNQLASYNSYGTIRNKENTLRSKSGRYYVDQKKYKFTTAVTVTNPESTIKTNNLDYYENSGHAYVFGPSTITSKENVIYTENGFYDTTNDVGKLSKNSKIMLDNKIIEGDDLYYDRKKNYSRGINNVKITDTINKVIATGHYAELYRNAATKKDSMILTKRALVKTLVEKDTLYMHGKKIIVSGPQEDRVIRAFNNVRFYKSDMSGKCDSLHSNNKTQLTKMIGKPILWNNENQMTGDIMHLIGNNKTQKLDSLKVLNNAFIIQKDSLSKNGYNQIKGQNLYGKFVDSKLKEVDVVKNAEVIYYMYNDANEFIGINKTVCSKINLELEANKINSITFFTKTDSFIYPEKDFPENARKLRGFLWRGDERILSKDDIFPAEEIALDDKIQIEAKKKAVAAEKPMEILPETLEFDDNKKVEEKKTEKKATSKKKTVKKQ